MKFVLVLLFVFVACVSTQNDTENTTLGREVEWSLDIEVTDHLDPKMTKFPPEEIPGIVAKYADKFKTGIHCRYNINCDFDITRVHEAGWWRDSGFGWKYWENDVIFDVRIHNNAGEYKCYYRYHEEDYVLTWKPFNWFNCRCIAEHCDLQ